VALRRGILAVAATVRILLLALDLVVSSYDLGVARRRNTITGASAGVVVIISAVVQSQSRLRWWSRRRARIVAAGSAIVHLACGGRLESATVVNHEVIAASL